MKKVYRYTFTPKEGKMDVQDYWLHVRYNADRKEWESMTRFRFGWRPQKADGRDFKLSITVPKVMPVRSSVEKYCSRIEDQGDFGSCVFNATVAAYEYNMLHHKKPYFDMSRFFPYYNVRKQYLDAGEISSINEDCGAEIRDAIKSVAKLGTCKESTWTYNPANFAKKPTQKAYDEALTFQITRYENVSGLNELKACISYARVPVLFGFWVYDSFLNIGPDGIMQMPSSHEECLGGHAVMMVGYDDKKRTAKIRNSWGTEWGNSGYFYMPYDFLLDPDECMDFWKITAGEQI